MAAPVMKSFEAKCAELAARYEMTRGWVRFSVGTVEGYELLKVQSHSDCSKRYTVTYDPHADELLSCSCAAGQHLRPCCHLGAARLSVEHRKVVAARAARYAWLEGA